MNQYTETKQTTSSGLSSLSYLMKASGLSMELSTERKARNPTVSSCLASEYSVTSSAQANQVYSHRYYYCVDLGSLVEINIPYWLVCATIFVPGRNKDTTMAPSHAIRRKIVYWGWNPYNPIQISLERRDLMRLLNRT